jgi:transposase
MASNIPWDKVKTEVCSTTKSIRIIAKEFGISDTAIRKRMSREKDTGEWERKAKAAKRQLTATAESPLPVDLVSKANPSAYIVKHLRESDKQFSLVTKLRSKLEANYLKNKDNTVKGIHIAGGIMKDLSTILERLIGIQRRALSLDVPLGDSRSSVIVIVNTGIQREGNKTEVIDITPIVEVDKAIEERKGVSLKASQFIDT